MGCDKVEARELAPSIEILSEQLIWMARRRVEWRQAVMLLNGAYALAAIDQCDGSITEASKLIHAHRNTLSKIVNEFRPNRKRDGRGKRTGSEVESANGNGND